MIVDFPQVEVINRLERKNAELTKKIESVHDDVNKKIDNLPTQGGSVTKKQFEDLKVKLNHVEKGWLTTPVGDWDKEDGTWGHKYATAKFQKPYTTRPNAFISIYYWGQETDKNFVAISANLETVNTTHLVVDFFKYPYVAKQPFLGVNWITFPSDY